MISEQELERNLIRQLSEKRDKTVNIKDKEI